MEIKIKLLDKKKDIKKLAKLFDDYRVYYGQKSDLKAAKSFLKKRTKNRESIVLFVQSKKGILGFVQLYPGFSSLSMKPLYTLNDLFVVEEYRGIGIGKILLQDAMKIAKDSKWKGLILETMKDNPARRLYKRMGFEEDKMFVHYAWQADAKIP